jgi:hypothetical protein
MPDPTIDVEAAARTKVTNVLALSVFWGALIGVVLISFALIAAAALGAKDSTSASEKVFAALVPLFGTWVGTILAFYFSRQNFEAANQSLQNIVNRLSPDDRLRLTPVKDAMIPRDKMVVIVVSNNNDAAITVADLRSKLTATVTRLPVLNDNGTARYIVHESMIYRYIAEHTGDGTLADIVQRPEIGQMIKRFGFVSLTGSLADAKRNMEAISGAQDVFVTDDGTESKEVRGWLTNVDVQKNIDLDTAPRS